jgi:hypothetical protein
LASTAFVVTVWLQALTTVIGDGRPPAAGVPGLPVLNSRRACARLNKQEA